MRYFKVRKEWSASDQESIVVVAKSAEEIKSFYKALGERGPRYITVNEVDGIFILENGSMKSMEAVA